VKPERLLETGYRFRFPDLEGALRHLLGRAG
jgi:NAD dependent epimerase/dehydratase family enzyme